MYTKMARVFPSLDLNVMYGKDAQDFVRAIGSHVASIPQLTDKDLFRTKMHTNYDLFYIKRWLKSTLPVKVYYIRNALVPEIVNTMVLMEWNPQYKLWFVDYPYTFRVGLNNGYDRIMKEIIIILEGAYRLRMFNEYDNLFTEAPELVHFKLNWILTKFDIGVIYDYV